MADRFKIIVKITVFHNLKLLPSLQHMNSNRVSESEFQITHKKQKASDKLILLAYVLEINNNSGLLNGLNFKAIVICLDWL